MSGQYLIKLSIDSSVLKGLSNGILIFIISWEIKTLGTGNS